MKNSTLTAAEKRISAFCARNGIQFKWQDLKYDTRRAVVDATDRTQFNDVLKKARRLSGVRVSYWVAPCSAVFEACVYMQDADAAAIAEEKAKQEIKRVDAWWTAYQAARNEGMDASAAGKYAESLYPTPSVA